MRTLIKNREHLLELCARSIAELQSQAKGSIPAIRSILRKIGFITLKVLRKYEHTFGLLSQGDVNWLQGTSRTQLQYSLIDPFRFMVLGKEDVVI